MTAIYRAVRWCVLVALAWGVVASLPSVARWIKIHSM